MREIKFRAIHKLTFKKWDEKDLYFHDDSWYEDFRALEDGRPLNLEQCAVMQYTGLKDKNGTEIYEGDIIRAEYKGLKHPEFETVLIFYDDYYACFHPFSDDYIRPDKYEVIGNIHEHKHLLEGM